VQVLHQVLRQGQVALYSTLDPETVKACGLIPVADLQRSLTQHLKTLGPNTPVAVMPEGPQTIPYIA